MVDRVPNAVHRRFASYAAALHFAKEGPPHLPTADELKRKGAVRGGFGMRSEPLDPADGGRNISMTPYPRGPSSQPVTGMVNGRGPGLFGDPAPPEPPVETEIEKLKREMAELQRQLAATEGGQGTGPGEEAEGQHRPNDKERACQAP